MGRSTAVFEGSQNSSACPYDRGQYCKRNMRMGHWQNDNERGNPK
jgi:hypothetical protein